MIVNIQKIINLRIVRQTLSLLIAFLLGISLSVSGGRIEQAKAQFIQPKLIAPEVYRRLPDFPLENHYLNQETGEVDSEQTLIRRFMRYHIYVKGRTPNFRLDWKLSLADYLGANERIESFQYPGKTTLEANPLEGDRAAISSLNRQQREQLVDTLVSIFNPNAANNSPTTPTQSPNAPNPSPALRNGNNAPSLPQPGAADLLMP